jgi:hypothetical protein
MRGPNSALWQVTRQSGTLSERPECWRAPQNLARKVAKKLPKVTR